MAPRTDEHDPRITMSSTWRPPLPKRFGKRSRWPRRARILLLVLSGVVLATLAVDLWLARDPALPRISRIADYHPRSITQILSRSGAPIGELVGERRTVVPAAQIPGVVRRAVVERIEPAFFSRPALGRVAQLRALLGLLRGEPEGPSITLALARDLIGASAELPPIRWWKEWIVARGFEHHLTRAEVLHLYLNQLPFGAGCFGVAEAARSRWGLAIDRLDARQAEELAALAGTTEGERPAAPVFEGAPGCAAQAARALAARFEEQGTDRLGIAVTTSCDLEVTWMVGEALHRQRLQRSGLEAAVVVMQPSTHQVLAMVGEGRTDDAFQRATLAPRPMGELRAPLVLAAALESLRWTAASPIGPAGETITLRALTARSPTRAADALLDAGLPSAAVRELAEKAGLSRATAAGPVESGRVTLTPLELATILATFAAGGERRQPQLLLRIGGQAKSERALAALSAMSPETAYLVSTMFPPLARVGRPAAGVASLGDDRDAWFGAYTPDLAVAVWVGYDDGRPLPKGRQAQRAALAVGGEVLTNALRKLPARAFRRPQGLVARRLDPRGPAGRILPSTATFGAEEWFLPRSLPREEPALPPE